MKSPCKSTIVARGNKANQIFHYKGDGSFAGQFGTPSVGGTLANAPGEAQNMSTVSPYKVGRKIYAQG